MNNYLQLNKNELKIKKRDFNILAIYRKGINCRPKITKIQKDIVEK